jgi:UDP-N-acetylglucosamine:LPS N-acetylglucosamine transferase
VTVSKPKLIALASGGGHWVQLQRLRPAFEGFETVYVSMFESYAEQVAGSRYYVVPDASRFDLASFAPVFAKAVRILLRERPKALVTTGSAPMLAFVLLARLMGVRTLWVDSIATSERLSSSGRMAKRIAHRVVSQWPEVAEREGVGCWGAVI